MSFPTTAALDNFTRANENPLSDGGSWAGLIFSGPSTRMQLLGDEAVATADPTGEASAYWSAASFSSPCEVWAKITGGGSNPYVMCCMSSPGAAPNGYKLLALADGSGVQLIRYDAGDGTSLNAWEPVGPSTVVGIGMTVDEGTLSAYYFDGSSWTLAGTVSDSTYTSGSLGLGYSENNTGAAFTDFGGGVFTPAPPPLAPPAPYAPPSRRGLLLKVTDLDGHAISGDGHPMPIRTPDQPQVTLPLSDSRTGQMDVPLYESIAAVLGVATSVVKVLYQNPKGDSILLINGIVLTKQDDFDALTTSVTLHDSTIRLKKRYLGYNHYSIMLATGETVSDGEVNDFTGGDFNGINSVYGIPLDGTGLRLMLLDASHGASDWRSWPVLTSGQFHDVPAMGIRYQLDTPYSLDDANRQPLYAGTGDVPPQGFNFTATATKGSATLTDVIVPSGMTISDVFEYGALFDGNECIADFAQVVSATSTSTGDIVVMSQPALADGTDIVVALEDAVYCQLSRGDCVYDDVLDMVQAQGAFEVDWVPVDSDHLGPSNAAWTEGQLCELYTANRVGTDRSQSQTAVIPVVFVHGEGGFHLTHSPDADSLITYVVEVGPGGPADPLDILSRVTYQADSVTTYGIWEDWEQATSAGVGDTPISNAVLTNRAWAILTAYQNVPQFMTATIDTDSVYKYAFGTDFFLGDTVTVFAKRGDVTVGPIDVRITSVGVTQVDADGNCQLQLTLVPYLTANPGISLDDNN